MKLIFTLLFAFSLLADVTSATFDGASLSAENQIECLDFDNEVSSEGHCPSESSESHCHCHMGHSHVSIVGYVFSKVSTSIPRVNSSVFPDILDIKIQQIHQEINRPPIA